jgi:hypothetical protein
VGGGVVFDSDEEAEFEETLHKGRTLFRLIEGEEGTGEGAGGVQAPPIPERPAADGKTSLCLDK